MFNFFDKKSNFDILIQEKMIIIIMCFIMNK